MTGAKVPNIGGKTGGRVPPGGDPGGEEGPNIRRSNPVGEKDNEPPVIRRTDNDGEVPSTRGKTGGGIVGGVTKVIAGIGIALISVLLALKLIPEAAADIYFGWLPEEYRMPALSSCCCSCSSVLLVLIGMYILPQFSR
jgi:hypothetical protein